MSLMNDFRRWRSYRRTVNELSSLNNRELHDLGLSRGDIERVARASRP